MCPHIIAEQMKNWVLGRNLGVQMLQERDDLTLAFAPVVLAADTPRAGVERDQEIQSPSMPTFRLHAVGQPVLNGLRGLTAQPRSRGCLLIHAQDPFVVAQGPCVQVDD
jgi:hypothetical protein